MYYIFRECQMYFLQREYLHVLFAGRTLTCIFVRVLLTRVVFCWQNLHVLNSPERTLACISCWENGECFVCNVFARRMLTWIVC